MTNREAMQIAAKEGFVRLYEIGKADGKAEAIFNQCNHDEAVKMAYEQGRSSSRTKQVTAKEMQIFDGLIAEYELRAKYNDDARDYETYSMLVKARGILAEQLKEQTNE